MKKLKEAIRKTIENSKLLRKNFKKTRELFSTMLVMFLLLVLIETVWQGSVTTYINLNYILIIVVILGIITALIAKEETKLLKEITKKDYALIAVTGVACTLIIWYKTQNLGWISCPIPIIAGVLVILLSMLDLREAVADADLIIEAVPENVEVKKSVFVEVEKFEIR